MSTVNHDVRITVSADGSQAESGFDSVQRSAEKTTASIEAVGKAASTVGGVLTKGLTVPIVAAAGAATSAAIKYEDAFAGVRKTVDMTSEEFDALYESTVALSETQPVSATELMQIEALGGQLGIANDKLLSFAQTVSGMDIATDLSAEEAATEMAQFANICSMSQDDMERLGSTVVALGNNTATTESAIMAMAMRIAGAGTSAGLSEADIVGLAAALSSVGIEAEAGGSAISTIISNIDKSVALGNDNLETWASTARLSADEFAQAWKDDPVSALSLVIQGMAQGVDEGGNLAVMLQELGITELRQTDTMKRLANAGDLLNSTVSLANEGWSENSALQNEVAARNDTTSAKLQVLRNRVENAAAKLGGPLADALIDVCDDLDPLIEGLGDAAEWFASLDSDTQGLIIGLAGVAAATGPALSAIGGVAGTVVEVRDAIGGLSGKAEAAAGKVGGIATAAGEAVSGVGGIATAMGEVDRKDVKAATGAVEGVGTAARLAAGAEGVGAVATAIDVVDRKTVKNATGAVEGVGKAAKVAAGAEGVTAVATALDAVDGKRLKNVTGAVEGVGTAASAASSAGVAVLRAGLVGLGAAVVIGAIATVAGSVAEVREKAERSEKAVGGIEGAIERLNSSSTADVQDGIKTLADDAQDLLERVQDTTDATNDLYDSLAQDNFSMESQISQVEDCARTMRELADQGALTEQQQAQLSSAVERFNDLTGESVSIIDSQTGKLSESADAIDRVTDAYKAQLRTQAYESALTELYTQQAEALMQVKDAQDQVNATQEGADAYSKAWSDVVSSGISDDSELSEALGGVKRAYGEVHDAHAAAVESLATATESYMGVSETIGQYEAALLSQRGMLAEATEAQDDAADAAQDAAQATDTATEALVEYETASGQSVEVTQEQSDALDAMAAHVGEVAEGMSGLSDSVKSAVVQAGYGLTDFGLLVESTGGTVERFQGICESLTQASDPFSALSTSLAYTAENAAKADEGLGDLATTTTEMAANIAQNQATVDAFNAVVADLYAQCETQADIAFVNQLVEKGPEALGELQNIAGTYEDANVSLHDLADAQANLEQSIANTAVSAELERMAAAYRVAGGAATDCAYTVDEATGNIIASVGAGADQLVVEFDAATGEVVRVISAASPEAQAAAEQLGASVEQGVDGTAESLSQEGDDAGQGFAQGVADGSDDAADSGSLLGGEAYGALVSLPDEMEARGKVAGYELAEGIKSQQGQAGVAGTALSTAAGSAVSGMPNAMGAVGSQAGARLASALTGKYGAVSASAGTLGTAAGHAVAGIPGAMALVGSQAGGSLASGLSGQYSAVWQAGSTISGAAAYGLGDASSWAWSSGYGLGSNFASGIRGSCGLVASAASAVASAAAAYLHHSTPDEGPLADDDRWGLEMAQNFAQGLESGADTIRRAARTAAQAATFSGAAGTSQGEAGGAGAGGATGGGTTVVVKAMYVRSESDVKSVAQELHRLGQAQARRVP